MRKQCTSNIKGFLIALIIIICLSAVLWSHISPRERPVRRVILISIDTLRPDYLGCYNPKAKMSPNIDRFAFENVLFTNVTSPAPSTAISHKSIFYSLYPSVHKTTTMGIAEELVSSPLESLQEQGFRTAAFVGGGELSRQFGFAKGFDSYWEARTYSSSDSKESLEELEHKVGNWLDENHQEKFFLFVHTYEVHCPYFPPKEYRDAYAGWYEGELRPGGKCGDSYYNLMNLTPADIRYVRDLYSAEIRYVDEFFGKLLLKLRKLKIYDQSLILLLSDHGESLGERGYVGHNFLYNTQLQVPLIMQIPGVGPRRVNLPVEAIDVMPTVFDVLNLKPPYPLQGRTLLNLVSWQRVLKRERLMISEQSGRIRVRKGNLTAIFLPHTDEAAEVYNLSKDPMESHNLAGANQKFLKECRAAYSEMIRGSQNIASKFILSPANIPRVDEETREQLQSLGYAQ